MSEEMKITTSFNVWEIALATNKISERLTWVLIRGIEQGDQLLTVQVLQNTSHNV